MNRTITKKEWYAFWHHLRKSGGAYRFKPMDGDDPLAGKQKVIDAINKHAVDGKVCVNERFMDCDCAVGTGWTVIPATWVHYERCVNQIYENAEGPGSTWLSAPENKVEPEFRDLALEAFENGHPHVVYP